MSTTVDNRVVSLQFDNKKFEENARESMSTLDKLKEKLQFKGATKGLEEIGDAAEKTNVGVLGTAVEKVSSKFSVLEATAVGALMNIGRKAEDAAEKLIRSLSIDQISAGWDKYGKKTESVQTIMNSTGETMENVSKELEKINWFTDETSYNFTDMVENVGKFTNNNIELERAVTAMQGIATWAGISGANSQQASRAMYNLSQAMGMGKLSLQDWTSLENAQMTTIEFRQTLLDTAEAMGTVRYVGDGFYESLAGNTDLFTIEGIRNSLTQGAWVTKDVLTATLEKYGSFATALRETITAFDDAFSVAEIKDLLDMYLDDSVDQETMLKRLSEAANEAGVSASDLEDELRKLADPMYDLGRRAMWASQISKTFADALNYTKDAVSTGWMNTFEHIFGNYEEATKLWSRLSDDFFYPLFVEPGENRNSLLKEWSEGGGRESLLNGLWNILNNILDVVNAVREAFSDIFPPMTADKLIDLTKRFEEFTEKIRISEEGLTTIKTVMKPIFALLRVGWELLKGAFSLLGGIISGFTGALNFSGGIFEKAGEKITEFYERIKGGEKIKEIATKIGGWIGAIPKRFNELFESLTGMKFSDALNAAWKRIVDIWGKIKGLAEELKPFGETVKGWLNSAWEYILGIVKKIGGLFSKGSEYGAVEDFAKNVGVPLTKAVTAVQGAVDGVKKIDFSGVKDWLEKAFGFVDKIKEFFLEIKDGVVDAGTKIFDEVKTFAGNALEYAKGFKLSDFELFVKRIERLSETILKVVNGFIGASILWEIRGAVKNVKTLIANISGIPGSISGVFNSISGAIKKFTLQQDLIQSKMKDSLSQTKGFQGFANGILKIAAALAIIAGAFIMIGKMNPAELNQAGITIGIITGVLAALALLFGVQRKNKTLVRGATVDNTAAGFLKMAGGLLIIAGALRLVSKIDNPATLVTASMTLGLLAGALGGILAGLTAIFGAFSGKGRKIDGMAKELKGAAVAFDLMAVGLGIIALSLKPFTKLNLMEINAMEEGAMTLAGLAAVLGAILAGMTAIIGAFKKDVAKQMIVAALAFIMMTAGLFIISEALKQFIHMDFNELTTMEAAAWALAGLATILGIFIAAFGAIAGALGPTAIVGMLAGAAAFDIAAFGLTLIAKAVQMMVGPIETLMLLIGLDGKTFAKTLLAVGGILLALVATGVILGHVPFAPVGALAAIELAKALQMIMEPLSYLMLMVTTDYDSLKRAIVQMGIILGELTVFGGVLGLMPLAPVGALAAIELVNALRDIMEPLSYLMLMASLDYDALKHAIFQMGVILGELAGFSILFTAASFSIIGIKSAQNMVNLLKDIIDPIQQLGENEDITDRGIKVMKDILLALSGNALLGAIAPIGQLIGSLAKLELAKAIDVIADPFIKLGELSEEKINSGGKALRKIFAELTLALVPSSFKSLLSAVTDFVDAAAGKKLGEAIAAVTDPVIALGIMPTTLIDDGVAAMKKILSALNEFVGGTEDPDKSFKPWFTKVVDAGVNGLNTTVNANGISEIADAVSKLAPAISELASIGDPDAIATILDTIGGAFERFGQAITSSGFWGHGIGSQIGYGIATAIGTKSKAEGIGALVEEIETLAIVLPEFIDAIDGRENKATVALGAIGTAFETFGNTLEDNPFWNNSSGRAKGVGALIDHIDELAEALPKFMELLDFDGDGMATITVAGDNASTASSGFDSLSSSLNGLTGNLSPFTYTFVNSFKPVNEELDEFSDPEKTTTFETSATKVTSAIEMLATAFGKLGGSIKEVTAWFAEGRANALTKVVDAIAPMTAAFIDFYNVFGSMEEEAFNTQVEKLKTLLSAIASTTKSASSDANKITNYASALTTLSESLTAISNSLKDFIDNLDKSKTKLTELETAINEIKIDSEGFEKKAKAVGEAFIVKLKEGITEEKNKGELDKTIEGALNGCVLTMASYWDTFYECGLALMSGLLLGINDGAPDVIIAISDMFDLMQRLAETVNEIGSPSKVYARYGKWIDLGLVAGLEQYSNRVMAATKSVAEDAIDSANDTINGYSSIFDNDPHMTMTITPVLDLTELYNGRSGFMSAIGGMQNMGVNTSVNLAAQSAAAMNAKRAAADEANNAALDKMNGLIRDLVNNPPSVNHNEFNITNRDPEEVAEEVSQILQRDIVRRNVVWQ